MNPADIALLVVVTGLMVGIAAWLVHLRVRRDIERQAESRTRQMSDLIDRAQCVLWESEVVLETDDWRWQMRLHHSEFCRQLFRGMMPAPNEDLWAGFQVDGRQAMDDRARAALKGGKPGYEQEFRATREGRTYWLHENVAITRRGPDRFWLVGLVTDITAQREAEAARRQSELTVERILANAPCLIWRGTVIEENGELQWPHFDMPDSQLSQLLFGDKYMLNHIRGFWDKLEVPDLPAMNVRSARAIRGGEPGYEQQFRVINRSGRTFWVNERVSITRVDDKLWSLVGVVTDITAQTEADQARKSSEQRLAMLLERADTLIWQAKVERRPDGSLNWLMFIPPSRLYRRLFATDPVQTAGFSWKERGVPESAEIEARCRAALDNGVPGYEQVFRVPMDGDYVWLSESVTINPTGPNTWDMVGVLTDITARRRAEEAWQTNLRRLGKILDLADCMVWEAAVQLRPDDTLDWDQYIPPSALYRRLFGEPGADGPRLRWSDLTLPEYPEMVARTLAALKARQPGYAQEFHIVQDQGEIWLRETVNINHLGDDRFQMAGVITDITAQRKAEEARLASEQRLGELLARADCLVWESTVTLRPEGWKWDHHIQPSLLYRRLTGTPLPRAEDDMWPLERVPERREMDRRCREALLGELPGYEQTFQFVGPDGEVAWISENVTIHRLDAEHYWLVGVAVDVTAQRRAEEARRQSELRLLEILTRAECLLWEATAEITPDDWSWQFNVQPSLLGQKLFGRPRPRPDEGVWRTFNIPERPQMHRLCREAISEGRQGYDQVFHILRPDGTKVWIKENVTIRPLGGDRYSLVGVAVDITAARSAELALAEEKERLAVTLRAMHEAVITTDPAGRIQFMNPAAEELLGYGAGECIGRPVQERCRLENAGSGEPVPLPVAQVARGDVLADLPAQTQLSGPGDRRRMVEGCCAPIHTADSKVTGTVLVLRDVTEQDRLEQELVRATRLESVGVLAGGIAHDFNNILTAVMGNLALAQLDLPPGSPAGNSVRSAEKAALRARDLTQQLLTFAKGGEPVRAAVQLEAVVREMASFALSGSQVKAHFDLAPDLWPADADKGQVGRVVQNLVINAVQAMPRGGKLRIVARNDVADGLSQPGLAAGNYILVAITDTGEGIKPELLPRIFDPYFTTKQTGTGLGLAAVYSIIKKHHGHIEVESQPGQGTTFRFWLPAHREAKASPDSLTPWNGEAVMKGRVLFMDDEEIIRHMAVMLLTRCGLAVDCAVDGAEAVAKYGEAQAQGRRYDLVIMDLTVPGGMGGLEALGRLRELDPQVKAVVSSGYSSDPVLANHREHGFAAVVAKPYEMAELARVLREVLPGA